MALSVLIVDDDPTFRSLAEEILHDNGVEVIGTAADAASAMVAASALRPDGALVDVGLPDGDGIELAYELASLPWRPRVVLTSSDRDAGIPARGNGRPLTFIPKVQLPHAPLRRLLTSA
jgi:DNA-binding NarL/FixJ family response regulator